MLLNNLYKKELSLQKNQNTCGIASIRNYFCLSFDYAPTEEELWQPAQRIYDRAGTKRKILQDGIGPMAMAQLIKNIGKEKIKKEFKVFMTAQGKIKQLEYFLKEGITPIIHRPFWEGDRDGHYEIVIGTDNNYIYLFNSARWLETSGIHRKTLEDFEKKWWVFEDEKWFLAGYPSNIILPREKFNGRYG